MAEEDELARYPDPFSPGAVQGIPGLAGIEAMRNQVATLLDQPGVRNALLQTGVSLLTPQWGSPIGHVGQAIGEGAAAGGRAQEAESKQELRSAQAEAAQARAQAAGSAASAAESRLDLARQGLDIKRMDVESRIIARQHQDKARDLREESNRIRAEAAKSNSETMKANLEMRARQLDIMAADQESKAQSRIDAADMARQQLEQRGAQSGLQANVRGAISYGAYRQKTEAENTNRRLLGQPEVPMMSRQEYDKTVGFPSVGTQAPAATEALPQAPANPADREAGKTYQTPQGPLKWTGTGWVR